MHTRFLATLASSVILAAGVAAPAFGADPSVTLRLGTPDGRGAASTAYIEDFTKQVALASGGSITIEPVWNAADGAPVVEDQAVAKRVADGDLEMGLVAWSCVV